MRPALRYITLYMPTGNSGSLTPQPQVLTGPVMRPRFTRPHTPQGVATTWLYRPNWTISSVSESALASST